VSQAAASAARGRLAKRGRWECKARGANAAAKRARTRAHNAAGRAAPAALACDAAASRRRRRQCAPQRPQREAAHTGAAMWGAAPTGTPPALSPPHKPLTLRRRRLLRPPCARAAHGVAVRAAPRRAERRRCFFGPGGRGGLLSAEGRACCHTQRLRLLSGRMGADGKAPEKEKDASDCFADLAAEYDPKKQNVSLYVFTVCLCMLALSVTRHAFFPPGRSGPQAPLPALVSTLPSDRGFSGPEGDYTATLAALKRVRRRAAPRARGARCRAATQLQRPTPKARRRTLRARARAADPGARAGAPGRLTRPRQHPAARRAPAPGSLAQRASARASALPEPCAPSLSRAPRPDAPPFAAAARTLPRRATRSCCSWATPSRSRCAATARARSAWRSCRACGRRRLRRTRRSRWACPATAPRTCCGAWPTARRTAWSRR
jgi:hypothetical protein